MNADRTLLPDSMRTELSPLLPGQAGDCPQAAPHLAPACEMVADTPYDSDALRGMIAAAGALAVVPANPRRRNLAHFDPCAYAKRHHIEQPVNKLKQHRRVATRYDKLDASSEVLVCARILSL